MPSPIVQSVLHHAESVDPDLIDWIRHQIDSVTGVDALALVVVLGLMIVAFPVGLAVFAMRRRPATQEAGQMPWAEEQRVEWTSGGHPDGGSVSRRAEEDPMNEAEIPQDGPTNEQFEFIVRAAAECERNAAALSSEAELLLRNGSPARALALAIASLEEHGKASMLLSTTTDFDKDFFDELDSRDHVTKHHGLKQREGLQSAIRVHGLENLAALLGGAEALLEIDDTVRQLREAALYVDAGSEGITSPLDAISATEATRFVTLAADQRRLSAWVYRTPVETLVELFQFYRRLWLEKGADRPVDDGNVDFAELEAEMRAAVLEGWELRDDPPGTFGVVVKKR